MSNNSTKIEDLPDNFIDDDTPDIQDTIIENTIDTGDILKNENHDEKNTVINIDKKDDQYDLMKDIYDFSLIVILCSLFFNTKTIDLVTSIPYMSSIIKNDIILVILMSFIVATFFIVTKHIMELK